MNEPGKTEMKQWMKPELVVLVRNKPEETVLAFCKGNDVITSYGGTYSLCEIWGGICSGTCDSLSGWS